MTEDNGWDEYKHLVLSELKGLKQEIRELRQDVSKLRTFAAAVSAGISVGVAILTIISRVLGH